MLGLADIWGKWFSGETKFANGLTLKEQFDLDTELKKIGSYGMGVEELPETGQVAHWEAIDGLWYPYATVEEHGVAGNLLEGFMMGIFGGRSETQFYGPRGVSNPENPKFYMYHRKETLAAKAKKKKQDAKKKKQAAVLFAAVIAALTAATVGVNQLRDKAEPSTVATAAAPTQDSVTAEPTGSNEPPPAGPVAPAAPADPVAPAAPADPVAPAAPADPVAPAAPADPNPAAPAAPSDPAAPTAPTDPDAAQTTIVATTAPTTIQQNRAPVAIGDVHSMGFNSQQSLFIVQNDTDADGDVLTIVAATQPGRGQVLWGTDPGALTDPTIGILFKDGFDSGGDGSLLETTFNYTIEDPSGARSSATVTVRFRETRE